MEDAVRKQIKQFHMIDPGDKVLVGFSGGADSLCLLQVLFLLKEELQIELGAVHCHHGIRGETADEDARFTREFCALHQIPFFCVKEEVEIRARKQKISTEEAGRQFRYETFQKIMTEEGYGKLAVAHNANDRAETMLFHLARGTGLFGLASMEPIRELSKGLFLIRPLLSVERKEIEQWLRGKGLSWRTDETNLTDCYTRNRVRHHILPELEQINEQAVAHMGKTAQLIGEAVEYIKSQEAEAGTACMIQDAKIRERYGQSAIGVKTDVLFSLHPYLQKSLLYQWLAKMSGQKKKLSFTHVSLLQELLDKEGPGQLTLVKGVRAVKEEGILVFYREEEKKQIRCPENASSIQLEMKEFPYRGEEISKKPYTKFFDCDKIKNRLCLRFWQPGDYLFLREDGGKKKLNRYFIDEKIPADQRGQIPLLADGDHIVWIVGYRISGYYKVSEATKRILSVTVKNIGE